MNAAVPLVSRSAVLVVDDNAAARYATARSLRAAGYRTLETSGGAEALELAKQDVTAVVLDVHLPDLHGFEVCRLLRSQPATAKLPIIHVSAVHVLPEDHVAGLGMGADAYLVRPVEPTVLVAMVEALIRARAASQQVSLYESRFRSIFERAAVAMALVDTTGNIVEANFALARLLDHPHAQLRGRSLANLAPAGQQAQVAQAVALWSHQPWQGQFALLSAQAQPVPLAWTVTPHGEAGLSIAVALRA